ncbi:uncharacterized protein BJX67DRAFT_348512 [Aspergillus lucknowensis]|uniref:Uncharacterized protein n=1 Tax=Aspergillus lucknowensis TaxID=176173 RepID=A0ABR4LWY9_9EURO
MSLLAAPEGRDWNGWLGGIELYGEISVNVVTRKSMTSISFLPVTQMWVRRI